MAVTYKPIDGEQVSEEIYEFLVQARRDGVHFVVREGHRTFARQTYFWRGWIRHIPGFNRAAFPSCLAPHIRCGKLNHALDLGNAQGIIDYGHKHGVHWYRTVAGESWHIEASAAELIAYAARHEQTPLLRRGSTDRRAIRELQSLLKQLGSQGFRINGRYDIATRRAVRRWQEKHGDHTNLGIVDKHLWTRLREAVRDKNK